jgi:hypothetical protein
MRISRFVSGVAIAAAISGTAMLSIGTAQAVPLIVNGGFETGDFTTGWTTAANSFPMSIVTSPVESGTYAAAIAGFASNPNTLSQTVSDTSGQNYLLSFWRDQYELNGPITLTVSWNGTQVFSEDLTGSLGGTVLGYQQFTVNVLGHNSDLLVFTAANDNANTFLDDVTLTPTAATPLPSTWLMLLSGFVGLGFFAYRGAKKNAATLAAA